MGILSSIVVGFIVGVIAKWLVRGNPDLGCIGTIALGITGSLIGGTVVNLVTGNGFDIAGAGFFGSIVGAVGLLLFMRSRAPDTP